MKGVCRFSPYNNNLCIVDAGTSSVLLVDQDFKIIKKIILNTKKRWMYSCIQHDFYIYVLDRDNSSILEINCNFQLTREIEIKLPNMFKKKISLREIKVNADNFYLTDNNFGNKCMHIFDLKFNYIKSFGFDILMNPYSFFFYKNEFIFVIERSNQIHIFNINDHKFEKSVTLSNCESAINGIILNNVILITSLLTVQLQSSNYTIPYLVSKIDAFEII